MRIRNPHGRRFAMPHGGGGGAVLMHTAESSQKRDAAGPGQPGPRSLRAMAGSYKLLGEAGDGAFARVFLAENEKGGKVAIKWLKEGQGSMRLAEAFFYNEMEALRKVDHPGVVKLFDVGRESGLPFLAMEYVDGKPLHRADRWRVQRCMLRAASLVCEALSAVHLAGIIHGDLIPGNIMLVEGPDGISIKLIDFGMATVPFLEPCPGWDLMRVGGAAYASPESQVRRELMDPRSDIYMLGATMYDMLARRPFFALLEFNDVRDPRRYGVPPEPIGGAGPGVNPLLAKALAKEPKDRFRDASEMKAAIDECITKAA